MAGKTSRTALQFVQKKLLGKANTSNLKSDAQELIGSTVQLGSQTIFGQAIPGSPSTTPWAISGGTVEYVLFDVVPIAGTTYDGNDANAGGDEAQSPGPHAYALALPSNYQSVSSNPKKGTGYFVNGYCLTGSLGGLQIIPQNYSTVSPNPYIPTLYTGSGGSPGAQIPLLDEVDWALDTYSGVLFLQDYDSTKVPAFVRAHMYIGDYLIDVTGSGGGGGGGAQYWSSIVPGTIYTSASLTQVQVLSASVGLIVTGSVVAGGGTIASGINSLAIGNLSTASALGAFSHGLSALASGMHSTAGGNTTIASGEDSHSEGRQTTAAGRAAHAEGYQTIALGDYSHVEGLGTIASASYQTVVGKYNKRDNTTSLFVIGNGSGDLNADRSDVLRVETGSVQVTGSLGATGGLSGSLTRLVDGTPYLIGGSNVTITSASNGSVTISSTGGSGTPAGINTSVQFNDTGSFGGTNNFTFEKNTNTLSVINISGSLTRLSDGTSYIVAGPNITINTSSIGQISITGSAGGGGTTSYPLASARRDTMYPHTTYSVFAMEPLSIPVGTRTIRSILSAPSGFSVYLRLTDFTAGGAVLAEINTSSTVPIEVSSTFSPTDGTRRIYTIEVKISGAPGVNDKGVHYGSIIEV